MLNKEFWGKVTEIYSLATRGDECKGVVVLEKSFENCKISNKHVFSFPNFFGSFPIFSCLFAEYLTVINSEIALL